MAVSVASNTSSRSGSSRSRRSLVRRILRRREPKIGQQIDITKTPISYARGIINNLELSNLEFDALELDERLNFGCTHTDILRSLIVNTSVKHASISSGFLDPLTCEKACVLLEFVSKLPKLESLSMQLPERNGASMLHSIVRHGIKLKFIEIYGLTLVEGDESILNEEAFQDSNRLRKIYLYDFSVHPDANADPFLTAVGQLPRIEEVEIRLKEKALLPGSFFQYLCTSYTLRTLVLWNMEIDSIQAKQICGSLELCSSSIDRLELWRCDLGPTSGKLLGQMVSTNESLETLVIAHVIFDGIGLVDFITALKENSTLKNLSLISVGDTCQEKFICTTVNKVMNENDALKSVTFHSLDEVDEDACLAMDYALRWKKALRDIDEKNRRTVCECYWD